MWSMDFIFNRTADGRVIKCLVIVDDASHEAVAIEVERAISGNGVSRVLDRLALGRGLPRVIRTDNGKELCGKAMVACATNASTSTGSRHCCMPVPRSSAGVGNTTRSDPRKASAS